MGAAVDSAGQPIISGKGLNEFLRNNRDTAKALFAKSGSIRKIRLHSRFTGIYLLDRREYDTKI
jgi:hypothetical protein